MKIRKEIIIIAFSVFLLFIFIYLKESYNKSDRFKQILENKFSIEFSDSKGLISSEIYQELCDKNDITDLLNKEFENDYDFIQSVKKYSYEYNLYVNIPEVENDQLINISQDIFLRLYKTVAIKSEYINDFLIIQANINNNAGFSNTIRNYGWGYSSLRRIIKRNIDSINGDILKTFIKSMPDETKLILSVFKQNDLLGETQNYWELCKIIEKIEDHEVQLDYSIRMFKKIRLKSLDRESLIENLRDYYFIKELGLEKNLLN